MLSMMWWTLHCPKSIFKKGLSAELGNSQKGVLAGHEIFMCALLTRMFRMNLIFSSVPTSIVNSSANVHLY